MDVLFYRHFRHPYYALLLEGIAVMRSEDFLKTRPNWLGREDLSDELTRLMEAFPHCKTTRDECVAVARRIDVSDENSWHVEWMLIADQAAQLADAAIAIGRADIAERHWLRAINYCQGAAFPFSRWDRRHTALVVRMRSFARAILAHRDTPGEVVTIPWRDDYPLQGYFLPAKTSAGGAPAVICFSEPGQRKEAHLFSLPRVAADRGLSLLLVDLLGPGTGEQFDEIVGSRHLETAVGSAMDYLETRRDVDPCRVAILADNWESSFVARGIAFDSRYAAAVCDAGLWDMQERAFLARRFLSDPPTMSAAANSRVARHIMCPVLIAMKAQGWLDADHVTKLVMQMKTNNPESNITFEIFTGNSDGAKTTLQTSEFMFDWLAARLGKCQAFQS